MKVLNFGSLNIDRVYSVGHIVLPGETLLSDSLQSFCGGKGLNQSIALGRAGCDVFHAGKTGRDGGMLREALVQSHVNADRVLESDRPTGHAIIQVDKQGQNSILLFSGANHDISREFIDRVLADFAVGDVLLLQNEISNVAYIMEKAHEKRMQVALNPSPISEELLSCPLSYVKWFILNEIEGKCLTGETEPDKIADALLRKYPNCCVVLTLGGDGVLYKDARETLRHGIYKVDCVDTTAAGDTFTGYFLSGVLKGCEVKEALRIASVAASIAVSRAGAESSIPTMEEVLAARFEPLPNVQ